MKRSTPRFPKLCLAFLFLVFLGTPCLAVQEVPPPDSNTQKTVPPVVTPVQAEPVRASNMLFPIQNPPAVQPKSQPTQTTATEEPKASKRPIAVLKILSKADGKIIPRAEGIIRLVPQTPKKINPSPLNPLLPIPVESDSQKEVDLDTSLMLLPIINPPQTKPTTRVTKTPVLDIPQHVLYPSEPVPAKTVKAQRQNGSTTELTRPLEQNKLSAKRDIIILKSTAVKPEVVQAEVMQPEIVQPAAVLPEVVQAEVMQPEVVQAEVMQPEVIQAEVCLLYTSPSPRDRTRSRMPSSA